MISAPVVYLHGGVHSVPTSTRGLGEPAGSYASGAPGVEASGYGAAFSHMSTCIESM